MVWSDLARPPLAGAALHRGLVATPDRPELPLQWLQVVGESPSTNTDLLSRAGELPDRSLLVTDHQTAGLGRLGRSWETPARSSITMSLLLNPVSLPPASLAWVPLLTGAVVCQVLRRLAGVPAQVKWPNDVLIGTEKVAGILVQGHGEALVIGIGLNVSQSQAELPVPHATSLAIAGAATTDRDPLVRAVVRALVDKLQQLRAGGGDASSAGTAATVIEALATLGQRVRVDLSDGTTVTGIAEGLGDDGALLVRDDDDVAHTVHAGDVHHLRPS